MRTPGGIICGLLAVIFLLPLSAISQQETRISDLEWMIGDWRAVEKSGGTESVVRLSVREADNHQAILYRVWIESKRGRVPKYNGMYYWHPKENTFKLLQVDNEGKVTEGTYEQTGNRVVQLVKTISDKTEVELRSEWEIMPKEFHFVGQFRPAGTTEWKPALDVTYSRMPAD